MGLDAPETAATLTRHPVIREFGVSLLVGFIAGAVFLLGHLMYAQLVLMPRLMASGKDVLAVSVDVRWSVVAAAAGAVAYLAYQTWRHVRSGQRSSQ